MRLEAVKHRRMQVRIGKPMLHLAETFGASWIFERKTDERVRETCPQANVCHPLCTSGALRIPSGVRLPCVSSTKTCLVHEYGNLMETVGLDQETDDSCASRI